MNSKTYFNWANNWQSTLASLPNWFGNLGQGITSSAAGTSTQILPTGTAGTSVLPNITISSGGTTSFGSWDWAAPQFRRQDVDAAVEVVRCLRPIGGLEAAGIKKNLLQSLRPTHWLSSGSISNWNWANTNSTLNGNFMINPSYITAPVGYSGVYSGSSTSTTVTTNQTIPTTYIKYP
jgi:hypothetical protein